MQNGIKIQTLLLKINIAAKGAHTLKERHHRVYDVYDVCDGYAVCDGARDTRDLIYIHFRLQAASVLPGRRSVLLPGHILPSDGLFSALHQVFRQGSETQH